MLCCFTGVIEIVYDVIYVTKLLLQNNRTTGVSSTWEYMTFGNFLELSIC